MIVRILVQESPKLELWFKRYGEKSFGVLFGIYGKRLGLCLKIFLNSRGVV
jgi:hypothetical protein